MKRANAKQDKAKRTQAASVGDVVHDAAGLAWRVVEIADYGPTLASGGLRATCSWERYAQRYDDGRRDPWEP